MARVRFSDVVKRVNVFVDREQTDLLYYVGGEHIDSDTFMVRKKGMIKGATIGYKFHFGFQPGHILFMSRNPHLRKCSMVDFAGVCSDSTYIVETRDENVLLQKYLLIEMQSDRFWKWAEENKSGSVNYLINYCTLDSYEFDLPPIEEQRALAEKLWAANDLKEKYQNLLAATDEMLKAKFREMFGEFGGQSAECGNTVKLEDLVEVIDERRKPINDAERSSMKNGELYPYYGATGIVDYVNQYLTDEDLLCISEDCGRYGPGEESSYIIRGKAWVNNHAHLVRVRPDVCELSFLNAYLRLADLRPYVSGTTRQKLTQSKMRSIECIKPSLSHQREFVAIANAAEASKAELKKSITSIDAVMKGLING